MTVPAEWGVAGLTDENGRLDRPVAGVGWLAPDVALKDDRLVWSPFGGFRRVRPSATMLESFIGLAEAANSGIASYAKRWGVFGVCAHDLPSSHNPPPVPRPIVLVPMARLPWCEPRGYRQGRAWESVDTWRGYARKFRAVLNVAARLHQGRPAGPEDWRELNIDDSDVTVRRRLAQERVQLGVVLSQFLGQARVGMEFVWDAETPALSPSGAGLFGALVLQLASAVGRSDGLAICSACSKSYIPRRRPRPDRRQYCDECRDRQVPQRDAAADYRQRRRGR